MKHRIHYQLTLSAPQLNYLSENKYHKNRMAFFLDLVNSAFLEQTKSLVPGCDDTINIGQVKKSEVQLARDWDCDRKTVSKVIAKMNELGIITTKKSNRTSVHSIHPVAAWIVDNVRIRNPYFRTGYVYNQIREGRFENITFVPDHSDTEENNASIKVQHYQDFPKGKKTISDKMVLTPTIRGIENFKKREERNSTNLSQTIETPSDSYVSDTNVSSSIQAEVSKNHGENRESETTLAHPE